jgi:AcrR family transcriptional regulator
MAVTSLMVTGSARTGTEAPSSSSRTSPEAAQAPPVSLRERKKRDTRRALRRIALELVADRGFSNVTVEDIATAADVSPRTFFNYFPTKEAALFSMDPDRIAQLRDAIVAASPDQPALDAVHAVMTGVAEGIAEEFRDLGGGPADWLRWMKAARADAHLRAAQAAQMAQLERAMTEGLAQRLGVDPERDPYPGMLAAVAGATIRSGVIFWSNSGGAIPLDQYVDLAFRALGDGLPEDSQLRHTGEA